MSDDNFLSRWSRRKHQVRRGAEVEEAPAPPPAPPAAAEGRAVATEASEAPEAPVVTPPLESLTPESDFAPFMNPKVDKGVRNQALKTLFSDPRYNVMDGLDVYIADYSKPDPLPEGWLEKMTQVARLGDYKPPEEEVEAPAKVPADPAIAQPQVAGEVPKEDVDPEPSRAPPEEPDSTRAS
jgi:hypothetical protein